MADMTVSVRLFAILRERAGVNSIDIELPERATVDDALKALGRRSELAEILARVPVRMAVNREYADPASELHCGDELALITPVSGGAAGEAHARISDAPLSLENIANLVACPGAGAVVVFQGTTRDVEQLDYEAYGEMAEQRIREILSQCLESHGLQSIAAEHRLGSVPLGEASVIVAVSAAHRDAAFAGAREAIDRIKAEAPIWKREVDGGAARWVTGVLP